MIVNTHTVLHDYDGKTPLKRRDIDVIVEDGKFKEVPTSCDLTLGLAMRDSLNYGLPKEKSEPDGDEKFRRFDISLRLQGALEAQDGQMSLTAKEVVMILESAKRFLSVVAYGRTRQILEPDEGKGEKAKDKAD